MPQLITPIKARNVLSAIRVQWENPDNCRDEMALSKSKRPWQGYLGGIMSIPRTLGELRNSRFSEQRMLRRGVKDELRENLLARLKGVEPIFAGIVGYDDTVIPQLVNAVLSRHNFILLGLRGQAKSRILRALTSLLDEQAPYIAGCEIRDNPYAPICRRCKNLLTTEGERTPIAWMMRDERYVEKLATPDVTIADLIGDIDPIKAARGGHELGSELVIHYGVIAACQPGHLRRDDYLGREGKTDGVDSLTAQTYTVRSTINAQLQRDAELALQEGLAQYEMATGRVQFRGLRRISPMRSRKSAPARPACRRGSRRCKPCVCRSTTRTGRLR